MQNNLGVPQGSVLGPLMFILYINDMIKVFSKCKVRLFADDTLIYIIGDNLEELINILNEELENVSKWLQINKLKLNTKKTKYMMIGHKKTYSDSKIKIDGEIIEIVKEMKYLGVILDAKLTFNKHAEYIQKKLGKKISFFGRIRQKISRKTALSIYNSIIAPHFNYCATILFLCNDREQNKLQILQNRAMRIILRRNRYSKISKMLEELNWLTVKQMLTLNTLIFVHKIRNNLLQKYFTNNIIYNMDIHKHNTRKCKEIRLPEKKKANTQNSLFYKGMKCYNALPVPLKMQPINKFKIECKKYIKCKT